MSRSLRRSSSPLLWIAFMSHIVSHALSSPSLNPAERPTGVVINASLVLHSISDPDNVNPGFIVDCSLVLHWEGNRLRALGTDAHNDVSRANPTSRLLGLGIHPDEQGGVDIHHFWLPDPFFENAHHVSIATKEVPTKNLIIRQIFDGRGNPGASFSYHLKQRIIVQCNMNFVQYPGDSQYCELRARSFMYPAGRVKGNTTTVSRERCLTLNFPAENLTYEGNERLLENTVNVTRCEYRGYRRWNEELLTFDGVCVSITFHRQIFHHFISHYVPSLLIVIVSFAPVRMKLTSSTDRINVSVTLLQAIFTVFIQGRQGIPPVPYATAMDIYMYVCIGFVISSVAQSVLSKGLSIREIERVVMTLGLTDILAVDDEALMGEMSEKIWSRSSKVTLAFYALEPAASNKHPRIEGGLPAPAVIKEKEIIPMFGLVISAAGFK
ncbi:gamma-aminobutyric acid receptor subunit rho-1-like [Galendromus occidentalis]|uniref:Gamma-aminobutyric acid receptor subunit rho-1-like n=1 Tax=Galendromus occidentalis TaxID=34638 RepID=A0AAJ6VWL7_9ACAR|nr:gamma-aminobutyric acid receptor subunit rho-1-like [Galendromus occidentalis]